MFITNTNTYVGISLITSEVLTDSHLKIKKGLNANFVLWVLIYSLPKKYGAWELV